MNYFSQKEFSNENISLLDKSKVSELNIIWENEKKGTNFYLDENVPLIKKSKNSKLNLIWENDKYLMIYISICMFVINFLDRILRFSVFSIPVSYWNGTQMKEYLGIITSFSMFLGMFLGIWIINKFQKERNKLIFISMFILCWTSSISFLSDINWIIILGKFLGTLPEGIFAGMLITFLEGRKKTDIYTLFFYLGAMLGRPTSTFIGVYMSNYFEYKWIPMIISIFAFIPLITFTFLITLIPKPDQNDIENKSERKIDSEKAKQFCKYFLFGIIGIIIISCTTFGWRTYRDYFTLEIYSQELNEIPPAWIYMAIDSSGCFFPLIMFIILNKINSNIKGFLSLSFYVLIAVIIIFIISLLSINDIINPYLFLFLSSVASYMLIPTIFPLFDRIVGASKSEISTLFLKNFSDGINNFVSFIILIIVLYIPSKIQLEIYELYGGIIGGFNIVIFLMTILFFYIKLKDLD